MIWIISSILVSQYSLITKWLHFFRLTKAQFDLQGKTLTDSECEERVKSIFSQCDLNTDGKITEEEFLKAGVSIAEMFELEAAEDE